MNKSGSKDVGDDDSLTPEQKEAMLNRKIEEMKKRNREIEQRHAIIEADRKAAEERGVAVSLKTPAEPIDTYENRDLAKLRKEKELKESLRQKDQESPRGVAVVVESTQYSAGRGKRLNIMKNGNTKEPASWTPAFLHDPEREGPLLEGLGQKSARDRHSLKSSNLAKVKDYIQRHAVYTPQTHSVMGARETERHLEWKKEREEIDRQRLERHKDSRGDWKREWDAEKRQSPPADRVEPHRRPGRSPSDRIEPHRRPDNVLTDSSVIWKPAVQW